MNRLAGLPAAPRLRVGSLVDMRTVYIPSSTGPAETSRPRRAGSFERAFRFHLDENRDPRLDEEYWAVGATDDDREAIILDIPRAFGVVRRDRITMHDAEVIDSYGTAEERAAARRLDPDGPWEEVPDQDISSCPWSLPHLDPESWRYYI